MNRLVNIPVEADKEKQNKTNSGDDDLSCPALAYCLILLKARRLTSARAAAPPPASKSPSFLVW